MTLPTTLPTSEQIREALRPLRRAQLMRLATLSGVSWNTVQKIASGETADPRIDTVAAIVPHIAQVLIEPEAGAESPSAPEAVAAS